MTCVFLLISFITCPDNVYGLSVSECLLNGIHDDGKVAPDVVHDEEEHADARRAHRRLRNLYNHCEQDREPGLSAKIVSGQEIERRRGLE
jgi:hypothetical protein